MNLNATAHLVWTLKRMSCVRWLKPALVYIPTNRRGRPTFWVDGVSQTLRVEPLQKMNGGTRKDGTAYIKIYATFKIITIPFCWLYTFIKSKWQKMDLIACNLSFFLSGERVLLHFTSSVSFALLPLSVSEWPICLLTKIMSCTTFIATTNALDTRYFTYSNMFSGIKNKRSNVSLSGLSALFPAFLALLMEKERIPSLFQLNRTSAN